MLKHHLLWPHQSKQNHAQFTHYLSLGAHQAPYRLQNINAFSVITLHSNQKFPQIEKSQEKQHTTALIVLKGCLRVDGTELGTAKSVIMNPKIITNQSENASTFVYLAFRSNKEPEVKLQIKVNAEKDAKQNLESDLFFLLKGKMIYKEGETEVVIKNQEQYHSEVPLFYAAQPLTVSLDADTVYLAISDSI